MGRCELRKTKPGMSALMSAPSTFCYAVSSAHVNNNLLLISNSLDKDSTVASWIINIELILVVITATMTGRLGERFGTASIMVIGGFLFSFFNILFLIPQVEGSFTAVLALRVGSSIGLGLLLPSSMPMATQLTLPGKLPVVVATNSAMSPIGGIVSALTAGAIAQASSWRYMFVLTGVISLLYTILLIFKLPFKVPTRAIKIDFLGVLMLSIGLAAFIVGVIGLSSKFMPLWASCVVVVVSLLLLVFFVYYNLRLSRNPIFAVELFNKSTMLAEFFILMTNIISNTERFYIPYVEMEIHGMSPTQSGMVMAIVGSGSLFFSPFANMLFKRMTTRYVVIIIGIIYTGLIFLNSMNVRYFYTIGLFTVINFCCIGIYLLLLVNIINYNFAATPMKYVNALGVLNQIATNAGHSLGVSFAVVANKFGLPKGYLGQVTENSVFGVYMVALVLIAVFIIIAFLLGTFKFERGKVGFKELNLMSTKSFEENLINDPEMVVSENLEAEAELSKIEKVLLLFNGL